MSDHISTNDTDPYHGIILIARYIDLAHKPTVNTNTLVSAVTLAVWW